MKTYTALILFGSLASRFTFMPKAVAAELAANMDYSAPFANGDPAMGFGLGLSQDLGSKFKLGVYQGLARNLVYDAERPEWELADTAIALTVLPRSLIPDLFWVVRLQFTCPTSQDSRTDEIYSQPEIRQTSRYVWSEIFQSSLSFFGRYTWSRFMTSASFEGLGGYPLPKFTYGASQSSQLALSETWSVSYGLSYTEIIFHKVDYEGVGDPQLYDQPDQAYSISAQLNALLSPLTSVQFGYSFGSLLLQPELTDYVMFDEEQSRWSVGLSHQFF